MTTAYTPQDMWHTTASPVWETRSPYLVKTVLAQKKELETQTTQEKARLRLDAEKQRKKASQLDVHYKQLQTLHKFQGSEISGLRAALKRRDSDIHDLQERLKGLENAIGAAVFEDRIQSLEGEKHELQQQLERTQAALDESHSHNRHRLMEKERRLEEQQRRLDEQQRELDRALAEAHDHRSHSSRFRHRSEWQAELVEELLNSLLTDTRSSIGDMRNLLTRTSFGGDCETSPQHQKSHSRQASPARHGSPQRGRTAHWHRSNAGSAEDATSLSSRDHSPARSCQSRRARSVER